MQATANKTVRPYQPEDAGQAPWLPSNAPELLCALHPVSAIWTGRVEGRVVAICGISTIHPHYAKCWTYLHPDAITHHMWLHRTVKRTLRDYVRASSFWRVDAECYETHVEAGIWLERLGLKRESVMPFYGPKGETMVRHAWYPRGLHG